MAQKQAVQEEVKGDQDNEEDEDDGFTLPEPGDESENVGMEHFQVGYRFDAIDNPQTASKTVVFTRNNV
jgi:hypothetical protein